MAAEMTVRKFHEAVLDLRNRFPQARLEPTASGNLVIHEGGVRRGYFDVRTGAIELKDTAEGDVVPDGFFADCGCAPGQHPHSTCDEFSGGLPDGAPTINENR